jgi:hypothetical protein
MLLVVVLVVAGAALVAPYNAPLGFYLGEVLGRPEVVESKKTILEAEQFSPPRRRWQGARDARTP